MNPDQKGVLQGVILAKRPGPRTWICVENTFIFIGLFILLFSDGKLIQTPGYAGYILRGITAALRVSEVQWALFVCYMVYFSLFLWKQLYLAECSWARLIPYFYLAGGLFLSLVVSLYHQSLAVGAVKFLMCIVSGQIVLFAGHPIVRDEVTPVMKSSFRIPVFLLILLIVAAGWRTHDDFPSMYRQDVRLSGPWDNPNTFGLMMGVGMILATAIFVHLWRFGVSNINRCILTIACGAAIGVTGYGLMLSYSRGAWLGTGFAWFGLVACSCKGTGWSGLQQIRKCGYISAIIIAIGILVSGELDHSSRPTLVKRIMSMGNTNDFSWRNRVEGWKGLLMIASERPWFGAGWDKPLQLYESYYLPSKVDEPAAIETNDCLILAASLGVPAFCCFGMSICLFLAREAPSTNRAKFGKRAGMNIKQGAQMVAGNHMAAACSWGATILLVGFWFDGGVFKLASGSTFWILLLLAKSW